MVTDSPDSARHGQRRADCPHAQTLQRGQVLGVTAIGPDARCVYADGKLRRHGVTY